MRESSPYMVFRHHYYNFPITMGLGNILLAIEKGRYDIAVESMEDLKGFPSKMLPPQQLVVKKCSEADIASVQEEVAALQPKFEYFASVSSEEYSKIEPLLQANEIDYKAVETHVDLINEAWNKFCDFSSLKAKALV